MNENIRINNYDQIEPLLSGIEGGILGAIDARIPSSKGKPKRCVVVMSYFGIHILRPIMLSRKWKIKLFVSQLNISKIECVDETTKIIYAENEILRLSSEDINLIVNIIIQTNSTLMQDSNIDLKLDFINYPKEKPRYPIRTEKNQRIQAIRFAILCAKYNEPFNNELTKLFTQFSMSFRTAIAFDSSIQTVSNPKPIIGTLAFESKLTILQLNNFCPECIGLIIYQALKKLKSLRSIVLSNYPDIQFDQFNFCKVKNPSVVAWKFDNCFSTSNFAQLGVNFQQFSEYPGDIQSLTFSNCTLSPRSADRISNALLTSRCFRMLEVLKFEFISTDSKSTIKVFSQLQDSVKKIPSLRYYSCANWIPAINHFPAAADSKFKVIKSNYLTHIDFSKTNFSKVLGTIILPPELVAITLENSYFCAISLRNMLLAISNLKNKIYFNLSGYKMSEEERNLFRAGQTDIKPFTNIVELHWNRNSFNLENVEQFTRIFLRSPHLKYLTLSGIFNEKNLNILEIIITAIADSQLCGLEIQGTNENNLGDKIFDLLRSIKKIRKLRSLDLVGHQFTDSVAILLLKGIKFMKNLIELRIDSTKLTDKTSVYGFYNNIMVIPFFKYFHAPKFDLERVIDSDIYNNMHGVHHEKFFSRFVNFNRCCTDESRMFFYSFSNDMTQLLEYHNNFPYYLFNSPGNDPLYLLSPFPTTCDVFSLWKFPLKDSNEPIILSQANCFTSPFDVPKYGPSSHEIPIPQIISKLSRNKINFNSTTKSKHKKAKEDEPEIVKTEEKPVEEENSKINLKLIAVSPNNDSISQKESVVAYDIPELQEQINIQHSIFPEDLDRTIKSLNFINNACEKISRENNIEVDEISINNPLPVDPFVPDQDLMDLSNEYCMMINKKCEKIFEEDEIEFEQIQTERMNSQNFLSNLAMSQGTFDGIFGVTRYENDDDNFDSYLSGPGMFSSSGRGFESSSSRRRAAHNNSISQFNIPQYLDSSSLLVQNNNEIMFNAQISKNNNDQSNEEFLEELMKDEINNPDIFIKFEEEPENKKEEPKVINYNECDRIKLNVYHDFENNFEELAKFSKPLDLEDGFDKDQIPRIPKPVPDKSYIKYFHFNSNESEIGKIQVSEDISDEVKSILLDISSDDERIEKLNYRFLETDDSLNLEDEVPIKETEEYDFFSSEFEISENDKIIHEETESLGFPTALNTGINNTLTVPDIPLPVAIEEIEFKQIPYTLNTEDDLDYPYVDIPLPRPPTDDAPLDLSSSEISSDEIYGKLMFEARIGSVPQFMPPPILKHPENDLIENIPMPEPLNEEQSSKPVYFPPTHKTPTFDKAAISHKFNRRLSIPLEIPPPLESGIIGMQSIPPDNLPPPLSTKIPTIVTPTVPTISVPPISSGQKVASIGTQLPEVFVQPLPQVFVQSDQPSEIDIDDYADPWLFEEDEKEKVLDLLEDFNDEYAKPTEIIFRQTFVPLVAYGFDQVIPIL